MTYVQLYPGSDRPLCPNSSTRPIHPAHELRVRLIDAAYEASDRDDDGEFTDPAVERVYMATAYGDSVDDRMHLYVAETSALHGGPMPVVIEAWFFKCNICGLILPANRRIP